LSAVALRLTDEVGQAVLDRISTGDLGGAAELDQHVTAVRADVALCGPDQPSAARLAGENAAFTGWPRPARPHHARRPRAAPGTPVTATPAGSATVTAACPDVPFADNPWQADSALAVGLLLHYACGFVEAAVRDDWWPANPAVGYEIEWQALRLAAICRLIRDAEATSALHPDLR
jgi:hypothetical protein